MAVSAELLGQPVVVIGGSSGIGLETPRRARSEGPNVVLTAWGPARLAQAGSEFAALSTAAFDATDPDQLERFFHATTPWRPAAVTAVTDRALCRRGAVSSR